MIVDVTFLEEKRLKKYKCKLRGENSRNEGDKKL